MKPLSLILAGWIGCAWGAQAQNRPFVLARAGAPQAALLVQKDLTPPERRALEELAETLKQIVGAAFPVREPSGVVNRAVYVGAGQMSRRAFPEIPWEQLGPEEILIRVKGDRLLLAGGRPRGALYAVSEFLQRYCGVRWWTPWASRIPRRPDLAAPPVNIRYNPVFESRDPFWYPAFDARWAVRNFSNSQSARIPEEWGGRIRYKGFVHTFYQLVPPDPWFKRHPEWFSMINGKRTASRAQLCLANPELRDFVTERVRQWLKESPEASIVSISQNDWHGACQCPRCKAIDQREGSHAGSLLDFVNDIAARLEPEFPHVAFDTLAYQYTRKPPRTIRPRKNVIVRLCSIECSFSQPLTHPRNQKFRDDIVGWSKICNRLYIWDYVTNFRHYLMPHPNLRVLAPNVKFFTENGVRGIFEQGAYTTNGAEMAELRAWVLAKLLWNPNLDGQTLIDQFLDGYYSPPAAKHIRAYLNLVHDEVEKTGDHLGCFTEVASAKFINFKTLYKSLAYLKAAQREVADDPVLTFRVRCATLPIEYAFMMLWNPMQKKAADTNSDWPMPDSIDDAYQQWTAIAKKKNISRLNEWQPGYGNLDKAVKKAKQ
ncbi:MAG: DUF4838 domain-containing protein [Verrucomicrobia bacterium]|nr:DUF4838 domain-containing protein [Verrucomicrobiota bacterium]